MGIISWAKGLFFKTPSIDFLQRGSRAFSFSNGELANNETIFAAITMLSNAIASAPISLRQGYDKVKPLDDNFSKLLRDGPNSNMSTFKFIRLMETIRNVKGNAYAIKEYDYYGDISSIWVLDSDFVTPIIDTDTKELWYRISTKNGDDYFHNRHIIDVSHISTDGANGISPISVLSNTLNYDKSVKELSLEQLQNSVNFRYAFKVNGNIDPIKLAEYHTLIESYMKKGIIYLDNGKSLEELKDRSSIDPKIFEVEEITVSRVARVFNIPPHKLQAKNVTYASAEQGDLEFLVDTVLPIARMYEQEFNKKCLSEKQKHKGYEVKFNLNGFARADMRTRGEFYFKMIRSAGLTPNEVRMLEDMPPKQGGDDLMVSRDLIAIKDLPLLLNQKGGEKVEQNRI
ncbi:phage portal protein [Romboutsia lituseburensis]|uniref:phage portal protein n=1 Tax=Romboutsia lituseburensis TaxID=1537 RepID=UPI00215A4CAD|nr:phage portal protein [Romboutsia lituseburensis]MCR8744345.1 phage portal protein [Romboutsia lituseburensis]